MAKSQKSFETEVPEISNEYLKEIYASERSYSKQAKLGIRLDLIATAQLARLTPWVQKNRNYKFPWIVGSRIGVSETTLARFLLIRLLQILQTDFENEGIIEQIAEWYRTEKSHSVVRGWIEATWEDFADSLISYFLALGYRRSQKPINNKNLIDNKSREGVIKGKFYDELQVIDKVIEEIESIEKEEEEQDETEKMKFQRVQ